MPWKTTLDRIPYEAADKTGRNATQVELYPAKNDTSYFQQFNLNGPPRTVDKPCGTRGVRAGGRIFTARRDLPGLPSRQLVS